MRWVYAKPSSMVLLSKAGWHGEAYAQSLETTQSIMIGPNNACTKPTPPRATNGLQLALKYFQTQLLINLHFLGIKYCIDVYFAVYLLLVFEYCALLVKKIYLMPFLLLFYVQLKEKRLNSDPIKIVVSSCTDVAYFQEVLMVLKEVIKVIEVEIVDVVPAAAVAIVVVEVVLVEEVIVVVVVVVVVNGTISTTVVQYHYH